MSLILPITLILETVALFFTLIIASKVFCVLNGEPECESISLFELVGCALFWSVLLYSHFAPLISAP
jgi:hypothetical protein